MSQFGSVRMEGVVKKHGSFTALHGMDLSIHPGEFFALLGPSGSGKTTTLRILAGLEEVNGGRVWLDDADVTHAQPGERDVAMVFQSYALYPHMTVAENMGFGLRLAGFSKQQEQEAVARAAQILQIEHLLERKPKALSGGQRQRVAIGRAIVRKPGVFLFDEPLSNLDAALRVQMRVELARLHRELKTTMIYVTHDQVEAMTLAHRIVVFNAGRIEQVGRPMDLYHRPANLFVAGFIGSPKMNFVQATLAAADASGAQVRLADGTLLQVAADARALPAGSPLTLGLRPEHLGAQPAGDALPANALRGSVQAAEHLGDSTYFYLDVPGAAQAVVVRADPENPLAAGDTALLAVPPQRAHLFDANGQALPRA